MKIKHEGLSTNQLNSNPREQVFAKAWKQINDPPYPVVSVPLELLLCSNGDGNINRDLSQIEATTAATVIQWLGSPVGWEWLNETMEKAQRIKE